MDLRLIIVVIFYSYIVEAKEYLRTGRGDTITIPDNSENQISDVLALLIVEHNADLEESNQSIPHNKAIMLPWVDKVKLKDYDMDSSGESNSDEYRDSDSEIDTGSESNFYHEEDHLKSTSNKMDLSEFVHEAVFLRKRWRSCQKKAAKVCREACYVSYKNACDEQRCRSKLKRALKKQCKINCKDFFLN